MKVLCVIGLICSAFLTVDYAVSGSWGWAAFWGVMWVLNLASLAMSE